MEEKIDSILHQAVAEAIESSELERLLKSDRPLNIKLGVDPTSPDLHLGHAVVLRKLKEFQDLGHQIYLVIGDFTAAIGDPAGVNKTRPVLTGVEIRSHMKTYLDQVGLILDIGKTHVVYNSEWLRSLSLTSLLGYAGGVSLNQLIEREDFALRLQNQDSVGLHELLYPLVQAIDSIHLKADVEIGGWDQRLNLLSTRTLQKKFQQAPEQLVLVKPLLGTDGSRKMSSSYHNYIGLTEPADQMFGKLMRVPDEQIHDYAELAAWLREEQIRELAGMHPKEAKMKLAELIVGLYHGLTEAKGAAERFDATFREGTVAPELVLPVHFASKTVNLQQAVASATGGSNSEAQRLIESGAVSVNGAKAADYRATVTLGDGPVSLQVGPRRFFSLEYKSV